MGFTDSCYLSPSLLQELGRRMFDPIYNYEKSEVIKSFSNYYLTRFFLLAWPFVRQHYLSLLRISMIYRIIKYLTRSFRDILEKSGFNIHLDLLIYWNGCFRLMKNKGINIIYLKILCFGSGLWITYLNERKGVIYLFAS